MTESRTLHPTRRTALAVLASTFAAPAAWAQSASHHPIRIIVGFGPGSGNDTIARDLAASMSGGLKHPIIVENRPGAGGSIGTEVVLKSAPDGLTLGLGTSSQLVMNVGLYSNLPFDVDKDLRMVGLISRTPMLLAGKASGFKSLKELIATAKANPGTVTYGSAGIGSISHIVGEAFARAAGIRLNHIPYKGNAAAMADLAGGHVDMVFDGISTSLPMATQGRVRILALSDRQRNPLIAQVPTFAELGLSDFDAYTWNGLFAPAQTPDADIRRLNQALNAALQRPAIEQRLHQGGSVLLGPATPEQADTFGRQERERWVPFIRSLKLAVN